jgi:Domain of unknown function (DUF4159)
VNTRRGWILIGLLFVITATAVLAQRRGFRGPSSDRGEVPEWSNEPGFEKDVFTFARIQYDSGYGGRGWGRSGNGWATDYRDADLNLSYRLQQLTSMKVDPEGRVLRLTDPELFNHPFIYIVEPGRLEFSDEEVDLLRRYLLSGGFLMVDDFWGEVQWQNFYEEMKRVLPNREPVELEMDHPIFHDVFDLNRQKNDMQIPALGASRYREGITWEYHDGEMCRDVHFKAYYDDKGRMMAFIAHNTDNGDGWEREGDDEFYFREYSEKKAYPLAINVVFYALTH